MMNIIKFGKTYVNFDNVTFIRDLSINLPAGGTSTGVMHIEFGKDYSIELVDGYQDVTNWLAANAANPPPAAP